MKISILGCGWLGLPLARFLIAENHIVKGSTTTTKKISQLREKGIKPFLIRFSPEFNCDHCDAFWESDVLILNIPPGRRRDNVVAFHTEQIKAVIEQLHHSSISFVIFVSSTSVYPALPGIVNEEDAKSGEARRASGNALLRAEEMLKNEVSFDTSVVRFGGLYGYDRHPANYLANKKDLTRAKAPVNLIHRDDCVQILAQIIHDDIRREIFNAVSDGHPPRKMYYQAIAKVAGVEPPTFQKDEEKLYKIVSNRKLKKILGYHFKYPNPMHG